MNLRLTLAATCFTTIASSAFAIGTTDCASADGKLLRTEQEVWGANPVVWSYDGQILANDKVKLDPNVAITVADTVADHPDLGEEHTLVTVEAVAFSLASGARLQDRVICRNVDYPNVYDIAK